LDKTCGINKSFATMRKDIYYLRPELWIRI